MGRARDRSTTSWLFMAMVGFACTLASGQQPTEGQQFPELRAELMAMAERDQDVRQRIINVGIGNPAPALDEELTEIDRANTARMKEVLTTYGWPTISMVGKAGANAAFILVQHADREPVFQREALALLSRAYEEGEAAGYQFAMMTDRVLTNAGQPQRYGTQLSVGQDGVAKVQPMEDPERVDALRREVGLAPMEEYLKEVSTSFDVPIEYPPEKPDGLR